MPAATRPRCVQLDLPAVVALELGQLRAGLCDFEPQLAAIERRKHLAGAHDVAFLDEQALDFALHLGDDVRVGFGFERGGAGIGRQQLLTSRLGDLDGDGGLGRLGRVLLLGRRLRRCCSRWTVRPSSGRQEGPGELLLHVPLPCPDAVPGHAGARPGRIK